MPSEDLIARLARQIDAAKRNEQFIIDASETAALRARGAAELHALCATFVANVNSRLSEAVLELAPPVYAPDRFREQGIHLIQISAQGRAMLLAFHAPREPVATEKFRIPYVLEGEIRTFNQQMLQRFEVRTQLLFYCVENGEAHWRYSDFRTLRTGLLTHEFLAELMEKLF